MTRVELVSLFWCGLALLVLLGVVVATIRMGLDEQAERRRTLDEITRLGQEIESEYFSGSGDVPRSPQQTTPADTSAARPADSLES